MADVTALMMVGPRQVEQQVLRASEDSDGVSESQVAGRTICSLISPGTELASGFAPPDGGQLPSYPRRSGYAAVFNVEQVGDAVSDVAVGDVLFCMGKHQSHQRVEVTEALPVPAGLDPFDAVFARLIAVPMATLTTTTARPGGRVGVSGLGLVGHLATKVFAATGYAVSAWDPVVERHRHLPSVVEVTAEAPASREGEFDLIIDCSGHEAAALDACRLVRPRGEVVLTGTPWARRTDLSAHELLTLVFHRYVVLRSGWEWELPRTPTRFRIGSTWGNLATALDWLARDVISVAGLAATERPGDAQSVYERLAARSADKLTAIFDWR